MTAGVALALAVQLTWTGVVQDASTRERVPYAGVVATLVSGGDTTSTVTDPRGRFVLSAPGEGRLVLRVTAAGYRAWADTLDEAPTAPMTVELTPLPMELEPLVARVGARRADPLSLRPDAFLVDSVLISEMPRVLEADVLRTLQLSPSVSQASDYTAVPIVRGGESYGTPVHLDGARLFNPFHLGGFFSALNPGAIQHVELVPGGAAGLETGSLSGSLELVTRDGARDRVRVGGGISPVSSRVGIEGPLGDRGSFLLDGRRTYVDLFTRAAEGIGLLDDELPYHFADAHLKLNRDVGDGGTIRVSGYVNREALDLTDDSPDTDVDARWSNRAASLQYESPLGSSSLLSLTLASSGFDADVQGENLDERLDAQGSMNDTRLEGRLVWSTPRLGGEVGLGVRHFEGSHLVESTDENVLDFVSNLSVERSSFVPAAWGRLRVPVGGTTLDGGGRAERFPGGRWKLSPSLGVEAPLLGWTVGARASVVRQNVRSLRNEESVYASFVGYDILVAVPEPEGTPRSREINLSLQRRFDRGSMRFTAYRRTFDGLRLAPLGEDPIESPALVDESELRPGEGDAWGIEATGTWRTPGWNVLGSYRWSSVHRKVGGERYVPRFHRDHELHVGVVHGRPGGSTFSARFSARSGQPTTPVVGIVRDVRNAPEDGRPVSRGKSLVLLGEYNSRTLPAYVRLDLGWRTEWDASLFGRPGTLTPYVALLNAFNSRNVVRGEFDPDAPEPSLEFLPQLPILPFFGLGFRF